MSKHDNIHETPDVSHIHNEGTFHEESDVDVFQIAKFGLALFGATVICFVLMYGMIWGFDYYAMQTDPAKHPMEVRMPDGSKDMNAVLPPEPRVQAAPGFRYVKKDGTVVNLELTAWQGEWFEYKKEHEEILEKGYKDKQGTVMVKPLEEVEKEALKGGFFKVRAGATKEMMEESLMIPSSSSSGRKAEIRQQ